MLQAVSVGSESCCDLSKKAELLKLYRCLPHPSAANDIEVVCMESSGHQPPSANNLEVVRGESCGR